MRRHPVLITILLEDYMCGFQGGNVFGAVVSQLYQIDPCPQGSPDPSSTGATPPASRRSNLPAGIARRPCLTKHFPSAHPFESLFCCLPVLLAHYAAF